MKRSKYNLLLIASFILPGLITIAALAALKVTPFGDKMLIFGDSYSYYTPWLSYFTSVLKGEHSMYYSFSDGIGANIALLDSTQLFHPISIFYLLAGWDYMPQAFSAAVIFDTSLCGFTMFLCLSRLVGKYETNIIFSTSYALMGYMVVYNYNPLFHMGVVFLPLMVLGLVDLIEKKKIVLYTLSIGYTVLSGFQMGFIVCMASFFMFVAYIFVNNDSLICKRKQIIVRYIMASITGGFLGSFVWIPALLSCTDRIKGTDLSDFTFVDNGPILQMAAKLFSGADSPSQIINGYPVIFCGILTVFLSILYFLNKSVSKREKIAVSTILGIYVLSFYIKTFKAVFQGFSSNAWFNHRQSFVFSFILLVIAAKEITYFYDIELKDIKKALIFLIISVLLIFSSSYEFITGGNVIADLLILFIILACFSFYRIYPDKSDKRSLVLIMLLCVSLQLYINYYASEKKILDDWGKDVASFSEDIFERQPLISALQETDDGFYRMEIENQMTGSMGQDPFLFHYNGVGHATYSSYAITSALHKLGINWQAQKANSYDGGCIAATDALLGLKYIISDRDLSREKNYVKKLQAVDNSIYVNPNALNILIASNDDIKDVDIETDKDIFNIQNNIWKAMTGNDEDIFVRESNYNIAVHNSVEDIALEGDEVKAFSEEMSRYMWDPQEDKDKSKSSKDPKTDEFGNKVYPNASYIEISFPATRDGSVYVYDSAGLVENYGSFEDLLKYIGTYKKGEMVTGRLYFDDLVSRAFLALTLKGLYVYYADDAMLVKYSNELKDRPTEITRIDDTTLTGTAVVEENQLLLFTIPYEKGWKLLVDGEETETFRSANLFLSAKVKTGQHSFELKYTVPGLMIGKIISLLAAGLLIMQVFPHCLEKLMKIMILI